MKFFTSSKLPIIIGVILVFFILGFIGFTKISKAKDEKKTLTAEQINKVKSNLGTITSSPMTSSNPFDYINSHKKEYNEIVEMGKPAVNYFIEEFKKGNLEGLNEWISAWICNEILGKENPVKIWSEDQKNGWDTGRDWFEKYMKIKNIK